MKRPPLAPPWPLLFSATLLFACIPIDRVAAEPPRPNIVVMIADDLAWDDLGCYGNSTIRTPNIDQLAASGMRWTNAVLTCSSCSPSRCSILTSRYPHATGAGELHLPLPDNQTIVTTPLREVGYHTVAAGKWHLGPAPVQQFDRVMEGGGPSGAEKWLDALDDCPADQPFFAWLAAFDPHRDYQPGAVDPPHDPTSVRVPAIFPDTPVVREDVALYFDEIGRFDENVGRVVGWLREQSRLENTLIVIMSDNGRPFPHCKTRVNVDGVRTPMVWHWPAGISSPAVTDSLMSSIDLAATFVELAGADRPPAFQGVSQAAVIADPVGSVRRFAFAEHNWHDYRARERAVHTSSNVLIVNSLPNLPATPPADGVRSPTYREMLRMRDSGELTGPPTDVFRVPRATISLHDSVRDPHCLVNLADAPEHASVKKELLAALDAFEDLTNDRYDGNAESLTPDRFDRVEGTPLQAKKRIPKKRTDVKVSE